MWCQDPGAGGNSGVSENLSAPRSQSPHSWMDANTARSTTDQQQKHPDVPLICSD